MRGQPTSSNKNEEVAANDRMVLIVDDDEFARQVLSDLVRRFGYTPVATDSVGEALAFDMNRIAVVLCDFEMPVVDGAEVVEMLRDWRGSGVPFVFVTALPDVPAVVDAAARFDARIVPKPVDPELLRNALEDSMRSATSTV